MKQKNKELLRALFDLQPANTNLLANHLNVSVRSIKNYVREINEEYPEAIHSSREGYRLDMELAKSILDETADHIPQTSEERVIYILNQLINHHQEEAIDIYDLSAFLPSRMSCKKSSANYSAPCYIMNPMLILSI